MAIRVPSRTRQRKYGYVERGDGDNSDDPRFIGCPTLIAPENDAFVLQTTATLVWSSVEGATSYNVYFWEEGDPEPAPINMTGNSYDVDVEYGVTYLWRVTAVNDFGESSGCHYGLDVILQPGQNGKKSFDVTQSLVSLSSDVYYVDDDQEFAPVIAVRVGASGAATVEHDTSDGTAVAPDNYTATSGTTSWNDGEEGNKPINIPIEPLPLVEELAADVLPPWSQNSDDPRLEGYVYEYRYGSTVYTTEGEAVAAAETALGYSLELLPLWRRRRNGENPSEPSPLESVDPEEDEFLNFQYSDAASFPYLTPELYFSGADYTAAVGTTVPPANDYEPFTGLYNLSVPLNAYFYANIYGGIVGYLSSPGDSVIDPPPTVAQRGWFAGNNCIDGGGFFCPYNPSSSIAQLLGRATTDVGVRRVPHAPLIPGSEFPDWPIDPDNFWWDEESGQLYSKEPYGKVFGNYRWLSLYSTTGGGISVVERPPLGPAMLTGDPADTEATWVNAYNAAVLAGDLPSGMTYDPTGTATGLNVYPKNTTYAWYREYKLPLTFNVALSSPVGATLVEPDSATVYILPA